CAHWSRCRGRRWKRGVGECGGWNNGCWCTGKGDQAVKRWQDALVQSIGSVRDAIQAIDRGALQAAFVVDEHHRLLGLVTDGDIRRGLLRGIGLDESVRLVMNDSPVTVRPGTRREEILALMRSRGVRHIPVVTESQEILDVLLAEDLQR